MTQPGDPPTSPGSGRSIYERLGLTPMPHRPPPRPVPVATRPVANQKTIRYLIGIALLILAVGLLWMNLPASTGYGGQHFMPSASNDDESRIDAQDAQIKQLEVRVETLELKMRALQEVNTYRAEENGAGGSSGTKPSPRMKTSSQAD